MRSMQMLRNDLFKPWFVGKDWGFEIIDGEFKDVTVQIEKLDWPDEGKSELALDYHVVHKPEIITDEDVKGDKFKVVIEVIINDILREAIDDLKQTRDNDTTESST
jgi:hypothetical protein